MIGTLVRPHSFHYGDPFASKSSQMTKSFFGHELKTQKQSKLNKWNISNADCFLLFVLILKHNPALNWTDWWAKPAQVLWFLLLCRCGCSLPVCNAGPTCPCRRERKPCIWSHTAVCAFQIVVAEMFLVGCPVYTTIALRILLSTAVVSIISHKVLRQSASQYHLLLRKFCYFCSQHFCHFCQCVRKHLSGTGIIMQSHVEKNNITLLHKTM